MMKFVIAALGLAAASAFAPKAALPSAATTARSTSFLMMAGKPRAKTEWVSVLKTSQIGKGELVPVEKDGVNLLIAADTDGSIYCLANICPHLGTPLDQGTVANGVIVCPLHKTAFSLKTGDVVGEWCPFPPILGPMVLGKLEPAKNVAIFPVRSSGSNIQVQLNKNLRAEFESNYWAGLLDAKGKATGEYY